MQENIWFKTGAAWQVVVMKILWSKAKAWSTNQLAAIVQRAPQVQRLKKVGTTTAPLRVSHSDGESVLIHGLLTLVADSFTASLPIRESGLNFASLQPRLFSASRITELIPCWTLAANFCQDRGKRKKLFSFVPCKISSWKPKRCKAGWGSSQISVPRPRLNGVKPSGWPGSPGPPVVFTAQSNIFLLHYCLFWFLRTSKTTGMKRIWASLLCLSFEKAKRPVWMLEPFREGWKTGFLSSSALFLT